MDDQLRFRWGDPELGGYDAKELVDATMVKIDPPQFHKGGFIPGEVEVTRLLEGEKIIDRAGYTRAVWSGGRLLRFPMWFSRYLPRMTPRS